MADFLKAKKSLFEVRRTQQKAISFDLRKNMLLRKKEKGGS